MREEGYYWVKYENQWEIAYFRRIRSGNRNGAWTLTAYKDESWWFYDRDFSEIDERRITQDPLPSRCQHDFTAKDDNGFTICSKCGEQYT